jgi:hypothetical protein
VAAPPVAEKYQSARIPEIHLDLSKLWRQVDARLARGCLARAEARVPCGGGAGPEGAGARELPGCAGVNRRKPG